MADRIPAKYFCPQYDFPSTANYGQRSTEMPMNFFQKPQRFMPLQQLSSSNFSNINIPSQIGPHFYNLPRQRYTPYYSRSHSNNSNKSLQCQQQLTSGTLLPLPPPPGLNSTNNSSDSGVSFNSQDSDTNDTQSVIGLNTGGANGRDNDSDPTVTLQISNLDGTIDDRILRQHLMAKLKPITPIMSFVFEGSATAKIRLPSHAHAKQVVAYLHRKKIGHKRITVSYTRDSSSTEPSTLRCQVAGLLKDMPNYKLAMYKFRELFQSRFKTSISVMDLYEMKDICMITDNPNEEKSVMLRSEVVHSIESSEFMDCLQFSIPYCSIHYKKGHRGWAEQDIEPLPNVFMTISQVRSIIFALLKNHKEEIPIASIVYCIQGELNVKIQKNENGVNLEHLISCVNGVQITTNKFGIKILSWITGNSVGKDLNDDVTLSRYSKFGNISDPFSQISKEIIELIKLSPKGTLKFSRFIPAYHNHFGKQCRVADYGYTKLIELFEALTSVVQIMGEGENRQITLTHKCQIRRFTTDLMRILRSQMSKSILLPHLPLFFASAQLKKFDITDYGVCDIEDMLEGLITSNVVVVETLPTSDEILISLPKRKQTRTEINKTSVFAGEVVELFRNASQFMMPFEKFACSYHYHFGYQCRLSDYGYMKLVDLMEAITGVVEIEFSNDEDRKIFLSPKVAQRIFSEQLKDLINTLTGSSTSVVNFTELLNYHKKEFGYQIQPQALGFETMHQAIGSLPYVEIIQSNENYFIICHHDDVNYRFKNYACASVIMESGQLSLPIKDFINKYYTKYNEILNEHILSSMHHVVEIQKDNLGGLKITISKMILFIIKIISCFDNNNTLQIEMIKSTLNLSTGDCFPFGYPNFISFIQAFPDIFIPSTPTNSLLNDFSEIRVNKDCLLTSINAKEYLEVNNNAANFMFNYPMSNSNSNDSINSTVSLYNNSEQENKSSNMSKYFQFNENYFNKSICNEGAIGYSDSFTAEKENLLFLDEKIMNNIDTNPFAMDQLNNNHAKLYERKPLGNVTNIDSETLKPSREALMSMKHLISTYFDPPKPDTPPINNPPFWMDPVWVDYSKCPEYDLLNIPMPDLKIENILPKLDTPTIIGNLAKKNKNVFSYDKTI